VQEMIAAIPADPCSREGLSLCWRRQRSEFNWRRRSALISLLPTRSETKGVDMKWVQTRGHRDEAHIHSDIEYWGTLKRKGPANLNTKHCAVLVPGNHYAGFSTPGVACQRGPFPLASTLAVAGAHISAIASLRCLYRVMDEGYRGRCFVARMKTQKTHAALMPRLWGKRRRHPKGLPSARLMSLLAIAKNTIPPGTSKSTKFLLFGLLKRGTRPAITIYSIPPAPLDDYPQNITTGPSPDTHTL